LHDGHRLSPVQRTRVQVKDDGSSEDGHRRWVPTTVNLDVAAFFATILFLRDPHTLFKRVSHGEHQRKRLVHRGLSLDDVKFVKNVMNCVSSINSLVFLSSISNFFAKTGMKSFHYCLKMTEMLHMSGQTVNDVLVGVTYAALSRYYFRNKGDDWQPYKNALF
jgi:hypothetical protein